MELVVLAKNQRTVTAVLEVRAGHHECPVLEFLSGVPKEYKGSAKGFKALFERYACQGRQGLTSEQFHLADQRNGIWEFIKGRLRLFCFQDGDAALVILSHGSVKKRQKVNPSDVERAIATKREYEQAKAARQVHVRTQEEMSSDFE